MIVSGWKTGTANNTTGAGYGIKLKSEDRDRFFRREWSYIDLQLSEGNWIEVNLSNSFWTDCVELRSVKIGKWLLENGLPPWKRGHPPKISLEPKGDRQFRLKIP